MTTPAEIEHQRIEQKQNLWKVVGIWLCFAVFIGIAVFAVFADSNQRNANRETLERLEIENRKTRDALWNLFKYDKSQFEAILKHLEKK